MSNSGYQPKDSKDSNIYTPESEIADVIKKLAILVSALTDDVIRMNADIEELKKKVQ